MNMPVNINKQFVNKSAIGFGLVILVLLFISCKKNKKNDPPVITISSPYQGMQMAVTDTIKVIGEITDDKLISHISIYLIDVNLAKVSDAVDLNPDKNSFHLAEDYILSNQSIPTGKYYLVVEATDEKNNVKKFIELNIAETPKKVTGLLVTCVSGLLSAVYKTDKNLSGSNLLFSVGEPIVKTTFSARYQLVYCFLSSGRVIAYNLRTNSVEWNEISALSCGGSNCIFAGVCNNDIGFAAGNNQKIIGMDRLGATQFLVTLPGAYRANSLYGQDDHLLAFSNATGTIDTAMYDYSISSKSARFTYQLRESFVAGFKYDNEKCILFTMGNNKPKVTLCDFNAHSLYNPHPLDSGRLNDATQIDAGTYLLAYNHKISRYSYTLGGLLDFLNEPGVTKIAYNSLDNQVFTLSGNTLKQYNYSNSGLGFLQANNSISNISDFLIIYSK